MDRYRQIFESNRQWVEAMTSLDPEFFRKRLAGQKPHFLYIGCADSRAPANSATGTEPGELFVHRNIANQVHPSDLSMLAVLQYAVDALDVKHILVMGHTQCGGVKAALGDANNGLVDNWLGNLRAIRRLHAQELDALPDDDARVGRLVELNVIEQVYHLTLTPTVREAWKRGRRPILHGLKLDIGTGLIHEIVSGIDGPEAMKAKLGRSAFV
jgi:carbonic anhydrase